MKLGMGDQVRVCLYSNYCEALDTKHKQVTCELWDRERRRLLPPHWSPPDQ
jgi:hypothetical protein